MATRKEQIINKLVEILDSKPDGMKYADIIRAISIEFPEFPINTIHGTMTSVRTNPPQSIFQPKLGDAYFHSKFKESTIPTFEETQSKKFRESDFYKPFADWLEGLGEVTKALPLGGNKFGGKWGTPDVIGKRESKRSDIIQMPVEIVTAEIKSDTSQLITAFGQACAYRLFSHKVYLVIPKSTQVADEIDRIDSLCRIFGIGLVLFDSTNPREPIFEIRVRAAKNEPDHEYLNENIKLIETELFGQNGFDKPTAPLRNFEQYPPQRPGVMQPYTITPHAPEDQQLLLAFLRVNPQLRVDPPAGPRPLSEAPPWLRDALMESIDSEANGAPFADWEDVKAEMRQW